MISDEKLERSTFVHRKAKKQTVLISKSFVLFFIILSYVSFFYPNDYKNVCRT
jgi:hypothetical protein